MVWTRSCRRGSEKGMDHFSIWQLCLLAVVGGLAGFINILAGGGSFLTVPILIFMGMPATLANATNRLGVFMQSLIGVGKFHAYGVLPRRFSILVTIPAVLGSVAGTWLATVVSDHAFRKYLALFMVLMTLSTFLKPGRMLQKRDISYSAGRWAVIMAAFFGIGLYGGFIQAGVGFLILSAMLLTGYDFVAGNATKTFTILVFTLVSLVIFLLKGMVVFVPGIALGLGSMVGAALGARVTVQKGNVFIQRFVVVTVLLFAGLLFLK